METEKTNPIFLVRHSERFDEVLRRDVYEQYLRMKQEHRDNYNRLHECPEIHFDPTISQKAKGKLFQTSEKTAELSTEDHKELMPYPSLYPQYRRERCRFSTDCDTPITRQGVRIAKTAAKSLRRLLEDYHQQAHSANVEEIGDENIITANNTLKIRLYSSRLQRCIQTAYVIARKCNIKTIYIATGLALTAQAVEEIGGDKFDFLSFQEIGNLCHDMKIIDCDNGRVYYGPSFMGTTEEVRVERSEHTICSNQWLYAFRDIIHHPVEDEMNTYKVVVIHRETIRNLLPFYDRCRLPYCAIGYCDVGKVNNPGDDMEVRDAMRRKTYPLILQRIFKPDGELLMKI